MRRVTRGQYRRYNIVGIEVEDPERIKWYLDNTMIFSYRKNMSIKIQLKSLTTDQGWGCVIRSGQSLLYNLILKRCMKGVDLGLNLTKEEDNRDRQIIFRHIVQYFNYHLEQAPFSFRNIIKTGCKKFDMDIEEFWDSPKFFSVIRDVLKTVDLSSFDLDEEYLMRKYGKVHLNFAKSVEKQVRNLRVLKISGDGVVPVQTVRDILGGRPQQEPLLVIPFILRLGRDRSEKKYSPFLFQLISLPWFSGMIGGVKNEAFYIFGSSQKKVDSQSDTENSKLLYLDPHSVKYVRPR